MATKAIVVSIDDKPIEVVLKSARKADGIWRAELMGEASKSIGTDSRAMVGFYLHPTCVAAVLSPDWVRQLTNDEFIDRVDEADMDNWTKEAYDLNPQWKQSMRNLAELGESEVKKTGTSSNGLTQPMEEETVPETSQTSKS